jgi:hypothetical protein
MELSTLLSRFLATDTPWLPDAEVMQWSLHVCWAVVLGAVTLGLSMRLTSARRWGLTLAVMFLTVLPGSISPAQWLGLAFQSPSLTSTLLCSLYLLRMWRGQSNAASRDLSRLSAGPVLTIAGIVLGWVLLLDTLAYWPVSVYAWGFSPSAFACVTLLVFLLWVIWDESQTHRTARWSMALVLTLYVATRLPAGNVWDALIDPWLWLILHLRWLTRLIPNRFKAHSN